jgi:urea transport system substrate-binding protein
MEHRAFSPTLRSCLDRYVAEHDAGETASVETILAPTGFTVSQPPHSALPSPRQVGCYSAVVLHDYVNGLLSPAVKAEVEQHLADCMVCTQGLPAPAPKESALESSEHSLKRLPASVDTMHADTMHAGSLTIDSQPREPQDEQWRRVLAPPETPHELGRLGHYVIYRILGRGGMGIVFEAEDPALQRKIALKLLITGSSVTAVHKERFIREARAAASLNNDHIVTIYEVNEFAGVPYLAMELLDGESLNARLKRDGRMSLADALAITRQIADGLSTAHSKNLIHRDIKPANLWIKPVHHSETRDQVRVKILDFGLARNVDNSVSLTDTGKVVGTPYYMAPEQAQGLPVDHRSDFFSLGCVLYQMLTGSLPFNGETAVQVLMAVSHSKPRPVPEYRDDCPPSLLRLLAVLMAKDPRKRPEQAERIIRLVREVEEELQSGDEARRTGRISRRNLLLGAAGIVAVSSGAYYALNRWGWQEQPATGTTPTYTEAEPIPVGILHSRTGTMANAERPVIDATLLAIEEVNQAGGVLGRPLKPFIEDGASNGDTFAQKAARLLESSAVQVIFGCWTSSSRKSVRPVMEKLNHLLFYPVQYEGLETSPNIVYLGAAPNQQIIPAIKWCVAVLKKKRLFLVGSDYVFPRAAHAIIRDQVASLGASIVGEEYALLGSSGFTNIVKKIATSGADVIINTINGDSNISFFRALRAAKLSSSAVPTISMSVTEAELGSINLSDIEGDYAACNYFHSIDSPRNKQFLESFKQQLGSEIIVSDPMEAAYCGVHLWARAVKAAQSVETGKVRQALGNLSFHAPEGIVTVDPATQHLHKTIRIGRINREGRFNVVYSSDGPLRPEPFPTTRSKVKWEEFLSDLQMSWGGKWANPEVE